MPELEDLVNYAILIAVAVGVILFITGKFIDLSIERQLSTQSRATINLLQTIVTEAPFLMTDSQGNKLKLMIDENEFESSGLIGCCDSVQYDYKFGIGKYDRYVASLGNIVKPILDIKTNYEGSGDFTRNDFCYTGFAIGTKSAASVPVNICEDGNLNNCGQAIATIETTISPLSELSYWIAQACSSEFDLSKRIPLSKDDYRDGKDLKIEDGNKVCFKGTCKEFSCGTGVKGDVDPTLLDQPVPKFPLDARCHFAKVVREGAEVKVIEGYADPVPAAAQPGAPAKELFFLPAGADEWTEGDEYRNYYSTRNLNEYDVTNNVDIILGLRAAAGKKSIILKSAVFESSGEIGRVPNVHDEPLYLNIFKVPQAEDCGGKNCIDMKKLGLDKISFKARVLSSDPTSATTAYLRWKITDVNGRCIEKDYSWGGGALGVIGLSATRELVTTDWKTVAINLLEGPEADKLYGECNDVQAETYPPSFTWKISQVELSVCERSVGGVTCPWRYLGYDFIKALAIDEFHFEGTKNE